VRAWFASTKHWRGYDPFLYQKESSFRSSDSAVHQLAQAMENLDEERQLLDHDEEKPEVLFEEMIQMSPWGNATTYRC